jgi:DNA repair ATPase RecN
MTIAQALKEKNKRLNQLNKLWDRLTTNNSIPEGNEREFNPAEILGQLREETDLYVELKTKIHVACEPVREKIFRLSELKNLVKRLKRVDTINGLLVNRYESVSVRYNAFLSAGTIDELAEGIEAEIESIQEELDQFNHTTHLK